METGIFSDLTYCICGHPAAAAAPADKLELYNWLAVCKLAVHSSKVLVHSMNEMFLVFLEKLII